jgi:O-antigen ligase
VVLGIYVIGYLLSYLAGYRRVLDAQEASSADRTLLVTLALVGLALTTADGVSSRVRLDRLLKRLLIAALLMALVGHLQFLARIDLTRYIRVPGLSLNAPLIGVGERGGPGFARVAGTAGHYIEFGVLMAMVLPIAIHYALFARTRGQRQWRWTVVILIFAGIPFSISRSAIVAVAAGLLCLGCAWTLRRQFNALAGLTVMVFVLQALKPGLIGTIRSLFTNVENDPSVQNRTADYEAVSLYFHQRPWLGLGQGTAMPDKTVLLDNQILGQLVGGGLVGLVTLLLIFVVGFSLGRRLRRTALDEETRHLGQALASVLVVALVASFTFDSFYFTTFAATLFLALGALGALWRLEHTDPGREHGYTPVVPVLRRIRYARSARS